MIDKQLIINWYKSPPIKFEIIKFLYNREMAVINKSDDGGKVTIRMLKCHNVQSFDFICDYILKMEQPDRLFNFYYSLAKYTNGIPNQDWRLQDRNNAEWTNHHWEQMESYDFLLDIDAGGFEELDYAYESAVEIKEFFDDKRIPYYLRFSGCGYHFVIPYKYLPQELNFNPFKTIDNIYKYCSRLGRMFHDDFSEMVDYKIYDSRRICKIPYSLSIYPKEDYAMMCFPFINDEQMKIINNNYRLLNYENLIPEANKQRGNYLFNADGKKNLELFNEVI